MSLLLNISPFLIPVVFVTMSDQACENKPCEHKNSDFFILYWHNKIFTTTAEFNGLSSTAYGNGILRLELKILAKYSSMYFAITSLIFASHGTHVVLTQKATTMTTYRDVALWGLTLIAFM